MASLSTDPNGNRTIQFTAADGKRRSIRLGKMPLRKVESIKAHVEHLNAAALSGMAVDGETAAWLAKAGDVIVSKLSAVGLVSARKTATLGAFLDDYIAGRTDVPKRTKLNLKIVARRMKEHFGADLPLRDITAGDADGFVIWMKAEGYATATTARTIKRAKQFFQAAVRAKLLTENPFAGIKPGSMANESRKARVIMNRASAYFMLAAIIAFVVVLLVFRDAIFDLLRGVLVCFLFIWMALNGWGKGA